MRRSCKVLIIKFSALGDIVHALGAVSIIKRKIPKSEIYWLTKRRYTPLFEGVNFIDHIITHISDVIFRKFDFVVDLQGLLKSSWFLPFIFSPCKAGFFWNELREFGAGLFYTKRVKTPQIHVIEKMRHLICEVLGFEDDGIYDFGIKPAKFDIALPQRFALIFPSAAWENKRIEPRWCKTIVDILEGELGIPFFILPGLDDYARFRNLFPANKILPSLGLKESISVISKASFVIGPDTGFLHIAAALRVPVVSLYCPTDPLRNGPYTERKIVIECGCPDRGCFRRRCFKNCTSSISPELVAESVLFSLRRWEAS